MDMTDIARSVAAAMGDGYTVEDTGDFHIRWAVIGHPETDRDFGIQLHHNAREKRISISPRWAKGKDGAEFPNRYGRPDLSITVSESREPAAIAREITRRFLEGYRHEFAEGTTRRDEHDAYTDRQAANLEMFAELLGGSVRGECVSVRMGDSVDRVGYIHGFQVGGNSVQWEFRSMPIETARKVLEFWKSL